MMRRPPVDFRDPLAGMPRWARLLVSIALIGAFVVDCFRAPDPMAPTRALLLEILTLAALLVINELLRPKPKVEEDRVEQLDFPTADEGRVIPLIWGRVLISSPNVVWYDDVFQEAVTEKVKTGLFSSERQLLGFKYHAGMQLALCRGPIDAIKRVWVSDELVFDGTATGNFDVDDPTLFGGEGFGNGGIQASVNLHLGTTAQAVNAYLGRFQDSLSGTTRTPRYTGTAYVVVRELGRTNPAAGAGRGGYLGNSTSIAAWKFELERYPALFSGQTAGQNKIGVDANPMNVLYEVLTNSEWGFGHSTADVDVGIGSSFAAASATLIAEANGFSMVLDSETEAADLVREIMRQVDGVVFLDHRSGKWKVKLARVGDPVAGALTASNVESVEDFTRGSWEDTTNQVVVKFQHRDNDYEESFALAQDMANAQVQGNGSVTNPNAISTQATYPGIKSGDLAANVAWRDLRTLSFPLARATFVVQREFWDVTRGDVVTWTDPRFGFVNLRMRVGSVDYGQLQQNKIKLSCVQDVFGFFIASFGSPPGSLWTPPSIGLADYPLTPAPAQAQAVEAPRGIVRRNPESASGPFFAPRIWCAARRQGSELGYKVETKEYTGSPSGTFTEVVGGGVLDFVRMGKLSASMPTAQANNATAGVGNVTVVADPDTQVAIETQFNDLATLGDLGVDLAHLIQVGTGAGAELMLVQKAANVGADVQLQNVFRGVLDTPQQSHAANDPVYLLFVGTGVPGRMFNSVFVANKHVDVRFRARSATATFAGTPSTMTVDLEVHARAMKPYAPAAILYNGSGTPFGTPSLEGAGGPGLNTFRIDVAWYRRRFDTLDEVQSLLSDDSSVSASHETQLEVRTVPGDVLVTTSGWVPGSSGLSVNRTDVITAAAAGTLLRFILRSRHDVSEQTSTVADLQSLRDFRHDVTPTSSLTGQFYFGGGLNDNTPSASYPTVATGAFTLTIGAVDAADVQVSVNGGPFVTRIAAGATTAVLPATTAGDGIRVQRLTGGSPDPQFVELKNPSSVAVAYGTFD